jgi:Ca2+-dependent lipid-binding protein
MRLYVYVMEAQDLIVKDSCAELQVGKHKSKTRILRNTTNPAWNEEFVFRVYDMNEELLVSVFHHDDDDDGGGSQLVGRVRIPVCSVAAAENNCTLPPAWYSFERPKSGKFINKDCG